MRQGVERSCKRRKQADKTAELTTKGGCLEFEGVLKVEKILDRKPVDKADEGS